MIRQGITRTQFIRAFKKAGLNGRYTVAGLDALHYFLEHDLNGVNGNYDLIPSELVQQYTEYKDLAEYCAVNNCDVELFEDIEDSSSLDSAIIIVSGNGSFINDNY